MSLANVEYRIADDALIAHVDGDVDMSNAGPIVLAIARATPNDVGAVVLDLTRVEYLDSAGIHMIYRLREGVSTRGQRLVLVIGPSSPVHDALRLAGVRGLVETEETVEQALLLLNDAHKDPTSA
ncbi:MAG: STAS domain-containing protein [Actinomycetota bacterium]|nr:STAS domain-containing protein [Actinomycetota bacterium]